MVAQGRAPIGEGLPIRDRALISFEHIHLNMIHYYPIAGNIVKITREMSEHIQRFCIVVS